eukprot:SAG31_NODE_20203_length_581_cov_0.852697_1_plen_67_part_00
MQAALHVWWEFYASACDWLSATVLTQVGQLSSTVDDLSWTFLLVLFGIFLAARVVLFATAPRKHAD